MHRQIFHDLRNVHAACSERWRKDSPEKSGRKKQHAFKKTPFYSLWFSMILYFFLLFSIMLFLSLQSFVLSCCFFILGWLVARVGNTHIESSCFPKGRYSLNWALFGRANHYQFLKVDVSTADCQKMQTQSISGKKKPSRMWEGKHHGADDFEDAKAFWNAENSDQRNAWVPLRPTGRWHFWRRSLLGLAMCCTPFEEHKERENKE